MSIIAFDTETTGLPGSRYISPDTLSLWPFTVQFSYIKYDSTNNVVTKTVDLIIKLPDTENITEESVKFHGITNEISKAKGVPIKVALEEFFNDLKSADVLVGHNLSFDIDMIKVELIRLIHLNTSNENDVFIKNCKSNLHYLNNYKKIYCTMKENVNFCKITMRNRHGEEYFKWPSLCELHEKLFDTKPLNLHNSLNDIVVTLRCYCKIKTGVDIFTTNDYIKNFYNKTLM